MLPENEADHSPSSSVEIKNDGAITPLLHTSSWHGAQSNNHADNFTLRVPKSFLRISIHFFCSFRKHSGTHSHKRAHSTKSEQRNKNCMKSLHSFFDIQADLKSPKRKIYCRLAIWPTRDYVFHCIQLHNLFDCTQNEISFHICVNILEFNFTFRKKIVI
jgi:hypothetical protein